MDGKGKGRTAANQWLEKLPAQALTRPGTHAGVQSSATRAAGRCQRCLVIKQALVQQQGRSFGEPRAGTSACQSSDAPVRVQGCRQRWPRRCRHQMLGRRGGSSYGPARLVWDPLDLERDRGRWLARRRLPAICKATRASDVMAVTRALDCRCAGGRCLACLLRPSRLRNASTGYNGAVDRDLAPCSCCTALPPDSIQKRSVMMGALHPAAATAGRASKQTRTAQACGSKCGSGGSSGMAEHGSSGLAEA